MSLVVTASVDEGKGTLSHMAPELHHPGKFGLRHGRVSKQADIYAFGIVVYEVLTGCPPFGKEGRRQAEIILRVMEGKKPSKPEKADEIGFGGGTWELVQQCWSQNRGERPTVEEVVKHFQRVAGTSVVVPPGPIMSVYEADRPTVSEPDSGAKEFSQCLHQFTHPRPKLTPYNIYSPTIRPSFSSKHKHRPAGNACRGYYGWR